LFCKAASASTLHFHLFPNKSTVKFNLKSNALLPGLVLCLVTVPISQCPPLSAIGVGGSSFFLLNEYFYELNPRKNPVLNIVFELNPRKKTVLNIFLN